jgi:hypothetical protein
MDTAQRKQKAYSIAELVFGNAAIILWIGLGAVSFVLFNLYAGLSFFALLAFLIFFEIGKHGCVTCYYCKTCTIGIGKLPEFFFKKEGSTNVNLRAQRLFKVVFVSLSIVPLALVAFSVTQEFLIYKSILFVAILGFSIYCGIVRRKTLLQ